MNSPFLFAKLFRKPVAKCDLQLGAKLNVARDLMVGFKSCGLGSKLSFLREDSPIMGGKEIRIPISTLVDDHRFANVTLVL